MKDYEDIDHVELQAPRGSIWAANIAAAIINGVGKGIEFISDQFKERPMTAQDIRVMAERLRPYNPSAANDLISAIDRVRD